jgi:hypothetical protein
MDQDFPKATTLAESSTESGARVRDAKQPNRFCNTTCDLCGTPMYRRPNALAKNEGKFCSRACRNKAHPLPNGDNLPVMMGANNPAWKGGVTLRRRKGNYGSVRYVRCPRHLLEMSRRDGYVMEHRKVMADWVGRMLTRTEVVHHLDHKPLNNERTNLELWPDNRSHKMAEHGRIAEGAANRLFLTD